MAAGGFQGLQALSPRQWPPVGAFIKLPALRVVHNSYRHLGRWRYTSGYAVWPIQREEVLCMETAKPFPPLVIAVVEDNPADVYVIARVLQAHQLPFVLQVLESRQRALHFFDQLAGE